MPLALSDKREFQVFKPEEAQRFAAFCREDPAGLVFLVALTTGLHPSEYLALKASDFDPPGRRLRSRVRSNERGTSGGSPGLSARAAGGRSAFPPKWPR
jgi:integrase